MSGRSVPLQAPPQPPAVKCILARLSVSLLVACVIPAALFYTTLVTLDVWTAFVTALVWSYAAIGWRWATKRRASGLLALTVTILTVRTVFGFSTGNTFIYFFQPVISDAVIASLVVIRREGLVPVPG